MTSRIALWPVVLLFAIPVISAVQVLEDDEGDVAVAPVGPAPPPFDDRWGSVDLLGLTLEESPIDFLFRLHAKGSSDPSRSWVDGVDYQIHFRHGRIAYSVVISESTFSSAVSSPYYDATLYAQEQPGQSPRYVAGLEVTGDPARGLQTQVPRALLENEHGVEPYSGGHLANLHVLADLPWLEGWGTGSTVKVWDRMPDNGEVDVPVQLGATQTGHIRLAAAERLRASNGDATTYLFSLNVTNLETYEDRADLTLTGVPDAWIARLPFPDVVVPANSTVEFPLLLTTPFAHQHGAVSTFLLEARSQADPEAVGRLDMGIEYLDFPHPAGHHDTIYLHGHPGSGGATMSVGGGNSVLVQIGRPAGPFFSTVEDDPRGTQDTTPGWRGDSPGGATARYGWVVPMPGAQRIGLDFDTERTTGGSILVKSPVASGSASIHGKLLLVPQENQSRYPDDYDALAGVRHLADIQGTNDVELEQDKTHEFSASVVPRLEGDMVPPDRRDVMVLVLWLEVSGPLAGQSDVSPPELVPGGSMRLPLNEYHDPVDERFAAPDFIQLDAVGSVERYVRPGGTVLFNLTLHNADSTDRKFRAVAHGEHVPWVHFPAGTKLLAPANGSVALPVAVTPPIDTPQQKTADIVVEAVDVSDQRTRGLIRLFVTVDGDRAALDDAAVVRQIEEESKGKDAASLPMVALFGSVALAYVVRRQWP